VFECTDLGPLFIAQSPEKLSMAEHYTFIIGVLAGAYRHPWILNDRERPWRINRSWPHRSLWRSIKGTARHSRLWHNIKFLDTKPSLRMTANSD